METKAHKTPRIYIDTSVIGGCFDPEFKEFSLSLFRQIEKNLWTAIISDITLQELASAPQEVRDVLIGIRDVNIEYQTVNNDIVDLAEQYILHSVIPTKMRADALHIACATCYDADILVSWNFKHIVNYKRIRMVNAVNMFLGFKSLEIRSPRELIYD
ncbi:MAG TPA: PIN domain-containing protein [Candidatus Cloacimonadota bacterium]|nr:PIN domain-containing protein [Candidatus Cloacimonadota bacterium]